MSRALARCRVLLALGALAWHEAASAQAPDLVVLDRIELSAQAIDGVVPGELSGLAWDADEQLLYAVSDQGWVFHFELELTAGRLRPLRPVRAARLGGAADAGARARGRNAEGLALLNADNGRRGDTELVVALEDGPQVLRYGPLGELLGALTLPPPLADRRAYRSNNSRLEAVAVHPRHGIVVAPQRPLAGEPAERHTLYAADGTRWSFAAHLGTGQIKAIEVAPDGRLVILERHGARRGRHIVLRELHPARCDADGRCEAHELGGTADLRGGDNFEGLAALADGSYLVVSDDGGDARERTVLLRFGRGARVPLSAPCAGSDRRRGRSAGRASRPGPRARRGCGRSR